MKLDIIALFRSREWLCQNEVTSHHDRVWAYLPLFKLLIEPENALSYRSSKVILAYLQYNTQVRSTVIEQTHICLSMCQQQGLASWYNGYDWPVIFFAFWQIPFSLCYYRKISATLPSDLPRVLIFFCFRLKHAFAHQNL